MKSRSAQTLFLVVLCVILIGILWRNVPRRPSTAVVVRNDPVTLQANGDASTETAPLGPSRRRLLLLTVDTLRADHVHSPDGRERDTAPFLAGLGSTGYRFSSAAAPVPRTTPALASLLTGAYPHTTKVRSLVDPLAPDMVTLAELLAQRGFQTVAVVSNHVLRPARELHRGFQVYDYAGDDRDGAATNRAALRHLRDLDPEQPLFLWVHYIDPHMPYVPPTEHRERFVNASYDGPYQQQFGGEPGSTGVAAFPADLRKIIAVYNNPLEESTNEHIRDLYAAEVATVDQHAADLMASLREAYGTDWTVVFTADHGESLGEQDYYWEHGDYVYDSTIRVPLSLNLAPGDPLAGTGQFADWVSLVDVLPTLVDLFGLQAPAQMEGRSLVPFMLGEQPEPVAVYAESGKANYPVAVRRRLSFDVAGRFRAVHLDNWKLIWTPGQSRELEYELYDLQSDPGETENLYQDDHPQAIVLRRALRAWVRALDDRTAEPDEEDQRILRSLGYLD